MSIEIINNVLKPQMLILIMFAGVLVFFRDEFKQRIRGSDKEDKE
jgi:hypothetical protein